MQILTEPVKAFIIQRISRGDPLSRIADLVAGNFHFEIDRAQIIACWNDRNAPPPPTETSAPEFAASEAGATRTRPGQEKESTPIPTKAEKASSVTPMARAGTPRPAAAAMPLNPAPSKATPKPTPTRTQPLRNEASMAILTDEIKEFIVNGLACFDTPSEVAEAVRVNFDITVSRQQVHEYDPSGSRPPAARWRALHAATRARFLAEAAEIGVAHKSVRLRFLDQMVRRCMRMDLDMAGTFLVQAAKECGGMYENRRPAILVQTVPVQAPARHDVVAITPAASVIAVEAAPPLQTPAIPVPATPELSPSSGDGQFSDLDRAAGLVDRVAAEEGLGVVEVARGDADEAADMGGERGGGAGLAGHDAAADGAAALQRSGLAQPAEICIPARGRAGRIVMHEQDEIGHRAGAFKAQARSVPENPSAAGLAARGTCAPPA